MISECSIKFKENDILTKEMLQHIYDDSLLLSKSLLSDVKCAIVSGLKIYNDNDGNARISSGILMIDGKMLAYDGSFVIKRDSLSKDQHYRVFVEKEHNKYGLVLEPENENHRDNTVFCFLYDDVGSIIKVPENLTELIRDNVYLDVFDMPYCDLRGNYICNPLVAKCLLSDLSVKQTRSVAETFIYYELLNSNSVSIAMLMNYIYGGVADNKLLSKDDLKNLCLKLNNSTEVSEETVQENENHIEEKIKPKTKCRPLTRKK